MLILNIAAGKFDPILPKDVISSGGPRYVLNVDTSYFTKTLPEAVETEIIEWGKDRDRLHRTRNLNMDVIEFMERTCLTFDHVVIYRFLEHVSFTEVEYFIYLVSTVLKKGGMVDVIVPNYTQLAEMILNEKLYVPSFESHNIVLTTELLNEPSCPHASIWTTERMKYFWELENRFRHKLSYPAFEFDGRDIYLRSFLERI